MLPQFVRALDLKIANGIAAVRPVLLQQKPGIVFNREVFTVLLTVARGSKQPGLLRFEQTASVVRRSALL